MGGCNDCYAFAALSGIAESVQGEEDLLEEFQGARIKNRFLTMEPNDAGCYAMKFVVDGQPREVVVDDFFPFMYNRQGKEMFAFAKS